MDFKHQLQPNNMEKMGGGRRRRNMRSALCIPKLRSSSSSNNNNNNNNNRWLSPMSLLERFQEAVFRLIMFTALSKTEHHTGPNNVPRQYSPPDQHHNEAVADCIEFIKKSALNEENRSSSDSDDDHLVLPTLHFM